MKDFDCFMPTMIERLGTASQNCGGYQAKLQVHTNIARFTVKRLSETISE
jgi:hypothetical protein